MKPDEIETLAAQVDRLDSASARRVARLVLECRASLRDALAAVHMADTMMAAPRKPARRMALQRLFGGRRERQVGMR